MIETNADYIAHFLHLLGVKNIHTIMGGGAATLNDAFGKHPGLNCISYHSEAGASYAAFGEAKYTNKLAVVNPTTGIAGINALAGTLSAYQDYAPVLIISGNVPRKQTSAYLREKGCFVRKMGIQENDIVSMANPITKNAITMSLLSNLSHCVSLCLGGDKGPVWLDVPADYAKRVCSEGKYAKTHVEEALAKASLFNPAIPNNKIEDLMTVFKSAERPLVLAGNGVHVAGCRREFKDFIKKNMFPFVTTFLGADFIPYTENNLNLGRIGIKGNRAANIALQQCDHLLVLGCSLTVPHVGYNNKAFAENARISVINIDNAYNRELVRIDDLISADLKDFFKRV